MRCEVKISLIVTAHATLRLKRVRKNEVEWNEKVMIKKAESLAAGEARIVIF